MQCWSKCDIEAVISDLAAAPWSTMESCDDMNDCWEYWKSLFLKVLDSHLPLRKVCTRSQTLPWISNVRKLIRARDNCCAMSKKSNIGSLAFTLYVNDLPQVVRHSEVKQYADDTTLNHASDNVSDLSKSLNADLEGVANWVEQNDLKLNEAKTQMLLLGKKKGAKELDNVNVELKGQKVARYGKVKYLGVWIDEDLSWRDIIIEAVRKKCYVMHMLAGILYTYFLGAQRWNSLPMNLRKVANITTFKANLRIHCNQSFTCP